MGLMILLLLGLLLAVIYLSANNYFRNWPAARLEHLRALLTVFLALVALLGIVMGRYFLVPLALFLALPIIRAMLNPRRDYVDDKVREKIATAMDRAEALRILELDEDEATPAAVESAYIRLMKLVHPDRGGTTYFAAKLNAARDFLAR